MAEEEDLPFGNHATLSSGLTAYYKMESDSIIDSSVNERHGTKLGGHMGGAGKINNCWEGFDDVGGGVSIPIEVINPGIYEAFTVSTWVTRNHALRDGGIFGNHTGATGIYNYFYEDHFEFNVIGDTGAVKAWWTTPMQSLYAWYMVTFRYNGSGNLSGLEMFVNGYLYNTGRSDKQDNLGGGDPTSVADNAAIAVHAPGANTQLNGKIDEIGFWNRALTGDELVDLFNEAAGLTY